MRQQEDCPTGPPGSPGAAATARLPRLRLSLIIPTYRYPERTYDAVRRAHAYLSGEMDGPFEILVVDDGSPPQESVRAADLPPDVTLLHHGRNLGKGAAVRTGLERACGEVVLVTDADLPFGLEPLATTLAWLEEGADIVVGDRTHAESNCARRVSPLRTLSSYAFTFLVNRVIRLPLGDTQCGYKAFRARVAKELFSSLEIAGFAYDVEILLRARIAGFRLRRQPLRLLDDEVSTVRLWRHAPEVFLDTLRIAWRRVRGRYD